MLLVRPTFVILVLVFGRVTKAETSQVPSDTDVSLKSNNGDIVADHTDAIGEAGAITGAASTTNINRRSLDMQKKLKKETQEMEAKTTVSETKSSDQRCPKMRPRPNRETKVMCYCDRDQIWMNGHCIHYKNDTSLEAQMQSEEVPWDYYEVIVKDVTCDHAEGHTLQQFTKKQFRFRSRGDVVLLKAAGDLEGQRINDYCVILQLDDDDNLTWMMKGCVPVPSVPRCCPPGSAMKEGSCQPADTPDILRPPISTITKYQSVEWPNIINYQSSLTCEGKLLETIPLSKKESHLLSLANGVEYAWKPVEGVRKYNYIKCPHFCVDGRKVSDGSVDYFVNICPSLRKCCKHGKIVEMVNHKGDCVSQPNSSFNPPTDMDLSNYNILIGPPQGIFVRLNGTIRIDAKGNLKVKDFTFPPSDYCVDTFITDGKLEQSVLYIPIGPSTWVDTWVEVRPTLFTVCRAISLVFLGMIIAFHIVIRKLCQQLGVYELCHSISLSIASFAFVFLHSTFNKRSGLGCFVYGITMQFGFLATFFWLNVMCFEIFMKIRYMKNYNGSFKPFPWWSYMLYAFGIPTLICLVTVMMQYLAPHNIPGLIKPDIAHGKCWFKGDMSLLAYFNGPAAFLFFCNIVFLGLTYYDYNKMVQYHRENDHCIKKNVVEVQPRLSKLNSKNKVMKIQDYIHEIRQKLMLLTMMILCWMTEIFSQWNVSPIVFSVTDTLNCLQGFFVFLIFIANRNKRKILKEKFPGIFEVFHKFKNIVQKKIKQVCGCGSKNAPPEKSLSSATPTTSTTESSDDKPSGTSDTVLSLFSSSSSSSSSSCRSNNCRGVSVDSIISSSLNGDSEKGNINPSFVS